MQESTQLSAPSRKGKERQSPQDFDFAQKVYAAQRKQAQCVPDSHSSPLNNSQPSLASIPLPLYSMTRPKEKSDRTLQTSSSTPRPPPRSPSPRRTHAPPLPNPPNIVVHSEPDEQEFSRRLKISPSSPRTSHKAANTPMGAGRLYNPNSDSPTPRRTLISAEPDTISDGGSSSYAPRGPLQSALRSHHPSSQQGRGNVPDGRLFDYKKDNPHKFAALPRQSSRAALNGSNGRPVPTPKSSGDYISASSTSSASYAHSTISSNFTLSSTTTDSSASSAIFDNARRSEESAGPTNALSIQLKRLYRTISMLEDRVKGDDRDKERDDDDDRDSQRVGVLLKGRQPNVGSEIKGADDESEKERWKRQILDHKRLADEMHRMLTLTLAPSVPTSLRNIPMKYNLIIRLWTHGFHRLLESLRRAAMPPTSSPVALEHLQEFIYYAYAFYCALLEERNLSAFRTQWIEALGDLARYRMAVSAMVEASAPASGMLTASAITRAALAPIHLTPGVSTPVGNGSGMSDKPASLTPARIDDSPPPSRAPPNRRHHQHMVPSVGIAAARLMVLEPEKERWRQIAREWYAKGLATTPGNGKLHHHLGLLSRDKDGGEEELRGVYHFVKSMITTHQFSTARESVLPLWSSQAQARRQAPDARLSELFVLLHGMLFTNIQRDDFEGVLARFEEKLVIEGGEYIEEREWIMMAVVNISAILEYGKQTAVLKRVAGIGGRDGAPASSSPIGGNGAIATGKVKLMVGKKPDGGDKDMEIDGESTSTATAGTEETTGGRRLVTGIQISPAISEATSAPGEIPDSLRLAAKLTFKMLSHVLKKPTRQANPFAAQTLNPYITVVLTFLATVFKDRQALATLERLVPWEELARFFTTLPRHVFGPEHQKEKTEGATLLTSGCAPLPEDWCLRGLGWGGKKVYERGFWGKEVLSPEDVRNMEMEVLDKSESKFEDMMDGIIEDEDDDEPVKGRSDLGKQEMRGRWIRTARAALKIGRSVHGLNYSPPVGDERAVWRVEGILADKVAQWREEERLAREEEERRLAGKRWDDDSMDIDDGENLGVELEEDSDDNEDSVDDSDEVKALKARRRYLQSLLESSQRIESPSLSRRRPRGPRTAGTVRRAPRPVPGYTTLVIDTNILLSSLSMFSSLVESLKWTIIIPLPVIMELDGLSLNASPLGEAASDASKYIDTHLRSHQNSLKVQTSKGNYLTNLSFRSEQVEFSVDDQSWERSMDDLILRAALWQSEHWVDHSALLKSSDNGVGAGVAEANNASKVTLVSFDRNLRLKARSRGVDAANEQDLASILATGT